MYSVSVRSLDFNSFFTRPLRGAKRGLEKLGGNGKCNFLTALKLHNNENKTIYRGRGLGKWGKTTETWPGFAFR